MKIVSGKLVMTVAFLLLFLVALLSGCPSGQGVTPTAEEDKLPTSNQSDEIIPSPPPPPERPENWHPKLSSHLNRLVMAEERGEAEAFAQTHGIDLIDDGVGVIIECVPGQTEAAVKAATDAGAQKISVGRDLVGAVVPINKLTALADEESIRLIRLPIPAVPATGN